MVYWLETCVSQNRGVSSRIIWKRCAACGSPKLLERVRAGQQHPEHWRVSSKSACAAWPLPMRKAG